VPLTLRGIVGYEIDLSSSENSYPQDPENMVSAFRPQLLN
jgi:hypothetical protein